MPAPKTIAIIGASGNMGSAIVKTLSRTSNRILLFTRHAEKLTSLLQEIKQMNLNAEVEVMTCPTDACWEADIIIPAIPFNAAPEIAEKIRMVATGKIVISITHSFNDTFDSVVTPPGTSFAEKLQRLLPYSKVVKVFRTPFTAGFKNPIIDGKTTDIFIAGNDQESLETVAELIKAAGFNPVITGKLSVSSSFESTNTNS